MRSLLSLAAAAIVIASAVVSTLPSRADDKKAPAPQCVCALDESETGAPTAAGRALDGKAVVVEGQAAGWHQDGQGFTLQCVADPTHVVDVRAEKPVFSPRPKWSAENAPVRVKGTLHVVKAGAGERVEVAYESLEEIALDAKGSCACGCSIVRRMEPGKWQVSPKEKK